MAGSQTYQCGKTPINTNIEMAEFNSPFRSLESQTGHDQPKFRLPESSSLPLTPDHPDAHRCLKLSKYHHARVSLVPVSNLWISHRARCLLKSLIGFVMVWEE